MKPIAADLLLLAQSAILMVSWLLTLALVNKVVELEERIKECGTSGTAATVEKK